MTSFVLHHRGSSAGNASVCRATTRDALLIYRASLLHAKLAHTTRLLTLVADET